jgi:hypothetical protein
MKADRSFPRSEVARPKSRASSLTDRVLAAVEEFRPEVAILIAAERSDRPVQPED